MSKHHRPGWTNHLFPLAMMTDHYSGGFPSSHIWAKYVGKLIFVCLLAQYRFPLSSKSNF
jgi:hypothetical protein